jgi:hypothetical protein
MGLASEALGRLRQLLPALLAPGWRLAAVKVRRGALWQPRQPWPQYC